MGFFSKKQKNQPVRQPKLTFGQQEYAFRKSRTLTGTTSDKINPSAEARSQLKTPRLKEHELRQQKSRVMKLLGAVSLVVAGLLFAIFNFIGTFPFHYPASIHQPPTMAYQESLRHYFAGRPLERFGSNLNTSELQAFMREKHPEILSFDITKAWYGGDVHFNVRFREPLLVWQSGGKSFFVDKQGVAFNYDHFGAPLVSVIDQSGISPAGSDITVASARFIRFLGKTVGAVNAAGQGKVISVIIPPSTREIDLKLEGREYPVKTHIDRDPFQQAEDISTALRYFDANKIKPAYVDVRVGGKAYYK